MKQSEYNRELASFGEKITLAELEEARAHVRVAELKFHRERFQLEIAESLVRQEAKNVAGNIAKKTED